MGVINRSTWRSRAISARMPGRCTFTATTVSLPLSVALYTCPMEADATGSGDILLKTVSTLRPSCCLITVRASSDGNGGTASCSWRSSSAYASGIRSVRMESACPSLMKVGPSCSHSARASFARCGSAAFSAVYSSSPSSLPRTSQSQSTPAVKAEVRLASFAIRWATSRGLSR